MFRYSNYSTDRVARSPYDRLGLATRTLRSTGADLLAKVFARSGERGAIRPNRAQNALWCRRYESPVLYRVGIRSRQPLTDDRE